MRKPNPTIVWGGLLLAVLLIGGIWAGVESSRTPEPKITLMLDADGRPAMEYTGSGIYDYDSKFGVFALRVMVVPGEPFIRAVGEIKRRESNTFGIFVRSSSLDSYQIQLVGFSTNETARMTLEQTAEIIPMPAGDYKTNLNRFIRYYAHPGK